MLVVHGEPALSSFRVAKKLATLRQICPKINSLQAKFVYLAGLSAELQAGDLHKLESLLHGRTRQKSSTASHTTLVVIPRPGTISPWSSKATDILHHCGLTKVARIERGIIWQIEFTDGFQPDTQTLIGLKQALYDQMTQVVLDDIAQTSLLFQIDTPRPYKTINLMADGSVALDQANTEMGLALSSEEIEYLASSFTALGRDPTDVELMMFAQANSEHCRHKIFNTSWTIDGAEMPSTLFGMIRTTHEQHPGRTLSAYKDNAAVMQGYSASRFFPDPADYTYRYHQENVNILMKVETHNHPTAISPFPGAATGSGGEIRDEAATGTGAKPKAGMTGFTVSNLKLPNAVRPWELNHGKPDRIVSALDIMIEGPIGAASFNNEFGRPALCGYFRSYEQQDPQSNAIFGYHKPIMLAGGFGSIRDAHVHKHQIPVKAKLIVLGGPAMLIGLGGGAASSLASGESDAKLDFASVQRDNPEMQRRCQEVIDRCWALGDDNPIISVHDVGAGGLSNALPELINESSRGAQFNLREIPNADPGMSPMEIWCNESQERYVLAINPDVIDVFTGFCERERAPYAIIGEADDSRQLRLQDKVFDNLPIDMPLNVLLGKPPQMHREVEHVIHGMPALDLRDIELDDAISRLLQLPTIADKRFLITIGDRSVSGLVARDQLVGPWQSPVADCAITAGAYDACVGEAMAVGERAPVAILNAPASGRLALTEAITNICAARILHLSDIALSANWMAACGQPGEDARLYDTVAAVAELARELKICIPVGKDSLSMNTIWNDNGISKQVYSPLSVNITAFAPVADIRKSLTPQLQSHTDTCLLLIDLAAGQNRLGGSCLAQVYNQFGDITPDLDDPACLAGFFQAIQLLNEMDLILAYHDRSDGGLFVTLCEMAFASHLGINIDLEINKADLIAQLFNEEPGAVIQIANANKESILQAFRNAGLDERHVRTLGCLNQDKTVTVTNHGKLVYSHALQDLHRLWSSTSHAIQSLRDNPECADEELETILDMNDPGLFIDIPFAMPKQPNAPYVHTDSKPKVAILREQGVNGQTEMAAAFTRAGFDCTDVHTSDLINRTVSLNDFHGLAACGGFSYGDVLGAGGGWAKSILFNPQLRDSFQQFFERADTFGLGVCNGCQMMSQLRELIPGSANWPDFVRNRSEQFEARLVMVEVIDSPSIFTQGMAGAFIPVSVAHGEGRVHFGSGQQQSQSSPIMRFTSNQRETTEHYPANPNGSPQGLTGFTSADGRFSIMMPHPERVFLTRQLSWAPPDWQHEETPWMQLFRNARNWID